MLSKEFVELFPTFKLEDNLILWDGSIDTIHQTYVRKKTKPRQHDLSEVAVDVKADAEQREASKGNKVFNNEEARKYSGGSGDFAV